MPEIIVAIEVEKNICMEECEKVLKDFFKELRKIKKK